MIIVEGPDGSGKTTLIERLGFERKHLKALRSGVGSEGSGNWGAGLPAIEAYANQLLTAPLNQAFDRFYLSETIYGPLLRGASAIRDTEVTVLRRLIRAMRIREITCLPAFETTMANVTREGRERPAYQGASFLRESYRAFKNDAAKRQGYVRDFDTWDYENDPLPQVNESSNAVPDYIGSTSGHLLIVGRGTNPAMPWPLFTMDNKEGLINTALWYAGVDEGNMVFVEPSNLHRAVASPRLAVLALDAESHATCREHALTDTRYYAELTGRPLNSVREIFTEVSRLLRA